MCDVTYVSTLRVAVIVRGDGGVAGEGRVVGVPKFRVLYFAFWGVIRELVDSLCRGGVDAQ